MTLTSNVRIITAYIGVKLNTHGWVWKSSVKL